MDQQLQQKFQEKLRELLSMAKKKKNVLEYQEVNDFFSDMELNEDQINHIYDFLDNNGVDVLRETVSDDDILDSIDLISDDEEDIDIENIDPREVRQFSKRPFLEVKTNLPEMESFAIPLRVVNDGGAK